MKLRRYLLLGSTSISLGLCIAGYSGEARENESEDFSMRIETLLESLTVKNESEREATVKDLAELGLPAALAIGKAARTQDELRHEVAIKALQQMGPPLIKHLCDILTHAPEKKSRTDAAALLGRLGYAETAGMDEALPALLEALDDGLWVRQEAISALTLWGYKSDLAGIEVTRRFVAEEPGFFDSLNNYNRLPEQAQHMLVDALTANGDQIDVVAINVLGRIGANARSVAPRLVAMLHADHFPVQPSVPSVLVQIMSTDAIAPLLSLLTGPAEEGMRDAAESALVGLGSDAVPALATAIDLDSFHVAKALSAIGTAAESVLLEATGSSAPLARRNALFALGELKVLAGAGRKALENAVANGNIGDQCMAAMALAKHSPDEGSILTISEASKEAEPGGAVSKVLRDSLFQLTALPIEEPGRALPEYKVETRLLDTENESEVKEEYWLQIESQQPSIPLSIAVGHSASEWREGFDVKSLQLRVVQPGRLLEATWRTLIQGNGKHMAGSILLISNTESGWREVFRHNGPGVSGGMGSGGSDSHTYQFRYSPMLKELRFQHNSDYWSLSSQRRFAVWIGSDSWAGDYLCRYTKSSEWTCSVVGEKVVFEEGAVSNSSTWEFPRAEWADMPEGRLDSLNPHMNGREIWTGMIYVNHNASVPIPDHTVYLRYPGTP